MCGRVRRRRAGQRRRAPSRGRGRGRRGGGRARSLPEEGAAAAASLRDPAGAAGAFRSVDGPDPDPLCGSRPDRPQPAIAGDDLRGRGRAGIRLDREHPLLHPHARAAARAPRAGHRRHARHRALAGDRLPGAAAGPGLGRPRGGPVRADPRAELRLLPDLGRGRRPERGPRGARAGADHDVRRLLRHLPDPVLRLSPRRVAGVDRDRQRLPGSRRERLVSEPDPDRDPRAGDRLPALEQLLRTGAQTAGAGGRAAAGDAARRRPAADHDRLLGLRASPPLLLAGQRRRQRLPRREPAADAAADPGRGRRLRESPLVLARARARGQLQRLLDALGQGCG